MTRQGTQKRVSILLALFFPLTVVSGFLCPDLLGCGMHSKLGIIFTVLMAVHTFIHKEKLIKYLRDSLAHD